MRSRSLFRLRTPHRAKIWHRRPAGPVEQLAVSASGQPWAWTCTCTGRAEYARSQPRALAVACAHVRDPR